MTKRNQSRANRCDRCGSSNWQGVKIAFNQSVRRTTGGYESVSRFGESIAPPPKRSLFSGPLFSATGLSCGTLLFLPAIRENDLSSAFMPARIMEPFSFKFALLVGAVVFFVQFAAAVRYNAIYWPAKHTEWSGGRVCRSCGHRFRPSGDTDGDSGDNQ